MPVSLSLQEEHISLRFAVGQPEHSIRVTAHGIDLCLECTVCKILRTGCREDKEIIRRISLLSYQIRHILSTQGIASAHGHKIAEIIQTVPESVPGVH